jgi:hypothetical protein
MILPPKAATMLLVVVVSPAPSLGSAHRPWPKREARDTNHDRDDEPSDEDPPLSAR